MKILYTAIAILALTLGSPSMAQKNAKSDSVKVPSDKSREIAFLTVRGEAPSWKIEISPLYITYVSDSITIKSSYQAPVMSSDGKIRVYKSQNPEYEIEVTVTDQKCTDRLLDLPEYVTSVKYRKIDAQEYVTQKGCALAVPDNRLNFVWKLREVKGQAVTPEDFGMELPYIDLHVRKYIFTGFAGCNPIKGNLVMEEGTGLEFSNLVISKMTCIEGNKESIFLEALKLADKYEIRNEKLYLLKGNTVLAVFTKAT